MSAQKAIQGLVMETGELLVGTEEKSISPTRDHWFTLQANRLPLYKKEKEKNWVTGRTWITAPLLDDKSSGDVFYPIAAPQSDVRFYIGSGLGGVGQKGDVGESEDGSLLDGSVRSGH